MYEFRILSTVTATVNKKKNERTEDEKKKRNCLKYTYFPCLTIQHHYHTMRHFMSAIRLNVDCIRGKICCVFTIVTEKQQLCLNNPTLMKCTAKWVSERVSKKSKNRNEKSPFVLKPCWIRNWWNWNWIFQQTNLLATSLSLSHSLFLYFSFALSLSLSDIYNNKMIISSTMFNIYA